MKTRMNNFSTIKSLYAKHITHGKNPSKITSSHFFHSRVLQISFKISNVTPSLGEASKVIQSNLLRKCNIDSGTYSNFICTLLTRQLAPRGKSLHSSFLYDVVSFNVQLFEQVLHVKPAFWFFKM